MNDDVLSLPVNLVVFMKTVREVCEKFLEIEKRYDLNQFKINGVYFWQLIRVYMYCEISEQLNLFGSPPQQSVVGLKEKILSFIPFIKNSLFLNPLNGDYQKKILVFDHPRKVKMEDGTYQDIYSYFLNNIFKQEEIEIIESPYLNKHEKEKENNIRYNDRILLGSYIYKKLNKLHISKDDNEKILEIEEDIKKTFNISINLFKIIEMHYLNFMYEYDKYDKLFKKRKPKKVFVVVSYQNQVVIAAAKDNNVEVIELQHGVITKYHLGYSYPNDRIESVAYFPDKLLSFGDYWREIARYPIKKDNIISIGFPYLDKNTSKYLSIPENKNQILFISQGVIGKDLSKFAYDLAKVLSNYNIIYKLHPGEYSTWKNYNYLNKGQKLPNFEIVDNNEKPLYELFAESEYQIGVFSTAIYEGFVFGNKTFIVDLPGSEYLDDLVDNRYVIKVGSVEDIFDNIDNFKTNSFDADYFFKKYNKSLIDELIH